MKWEEKQRTFFFTMWISTVYVQKQAKKVLIHKAVFRNSMWFFPGTAPFTITNLFEEGDRGTNHFCREMVKSMSGGSTTEN